MRYQKTAGIFSANTTSAGKRRKRSTSASIDPSEEGRKHENTHKDTCFPDCSALRDILEASNATYGCDVDSGIWYAGGDPVLSSHLAKFNDTLSYYECALICAGSPNCQFWSFDQGDCQLTSSEPSERQSKSTATSGPRICGMLASSLYQGMLH